MVNYFCPPNDNFIHLSCLSKFEILGIAHVVSLRVPFWFYKQSEVDELCMEVLSRAVKRHGMLQGRSF